MTRILIEIHEGQIVRNLLENGFLQLLTVYGAEVAVLTPGARIEAFTKRYAQSRATFADLSIMRSLTRLENYELALGSWMCRRGHGKLRQLLWQSCGEPLALRGADAEQDLIAVWKPDVVVSTHLSQTYGRRLVATARRRGIPTVGNLMSWDNAWKGLRVRPDLVTCWSEQNRAEICHLAGYRPEQVRVIGAPAFDTYLAADALWSREQLCFRLGLDPQRLILLFATLGQFRQDIDETNPLEVLLRAIDASEIPGKPQIVLRMHPWSRDAYFKAFTDRSDVVVSRYEHYVPGLTWTPTRDEAILAGNLLRHANVVISPGSTMCIEPAIFDTPTVVPVFNEYMPEVFEAYFRQTWLNQHFGRLYRNDWVPIVRSAEAMVDAVNRALADHSWYQEGRRQIREQILGPLDGRATERFAEIILATAQRRVPLRTRTVPDLHPKGGPL